MNQERKKPFTPTKVILLVAILILAVITTAVIVLSNQDDGIKDTLTTIDGLPDDIPKDTKKLIEAGLYDAIDLNIPEEDTPPTTGAVVRNGTLENDYDEETKIHYGDFITDIESVKLSFKVHYEWSSIKDNGNLSGYPVEVLCVDKSEQVYNTPSCSDVFHQADPKIDDFSDEYLPYVSKTDSGIDYNIIKDYPDRDPVITVISYTCEGSNGAKEVKVAADVWIKSKNRNIDLSAIEYRNYCDEMMNYFPPVVKID